MTAPAVAGKPPVVIPPVPVDYFQRYGKILQPGTEPSHPLKLSMPAPEVGQVKIPSPEEMALRDKIERLTTMSDDDIRKDLANWPAFRQMSLADEGQMLMRIQAFKDHRAKDAEQCAHDLGLLTLKPDQLDKFTKEYWQLRLQMDHDLVKQFQPIYAARKAKMEEQLFREYSTPVKPVPAPAVAQKPGTPPAKPPVPAPPAGAFSETKIGAEAPASAAPQPMMHQ